MAKNKAKDWAEECANSKDTMVMVPESMTDEANDFQVKTDEYLAKAKEFDKLSASFDVFAKNFWHKVRQALEDGGMEEIWSKNIGWNEEAKKEGIKVINIMAGGRGPMQMR